MPLTEAELYTYVVESNRRTNHRRTLRSSYGYNKILGTDLVQVCEALRERFSPPLRVLDIGCGNGLALEQLGDALRRRGWGPEAVELWGMGLNEYEGMRVGPDRFLKTGLNAYEPDGTRFHLVVSVFAFHYLWHKLEGVQKVHDELLEDGGRAVLHFPGYLVRFGEGARALRQGEEGGNEAFAAFLDGLATDASARYTLVPYDSDDDDCILLAEFGHLDIEKRPGTSLDFGKSLQGFAFFSDGFKFARMNNGSLTYVASHYVPAMRDAREPYYLEVVPATVGERSFTIDVAVHAHDHDRIVLMCPGAFEPLHGRLLDPEPFVAAFEDGGLGALVRYGDPFDGTGDGIEMLLACLRQMIGYVLENAKEICGHPDPRIGVMAYSSSGGAVAALAAEFEAIDSLLLVAPSFDVPRPRIEAGLERFEGEVYVMIGDEDDVVLPQQAFWFYEAARRARCREYVEVPGCGHAFRRAVDRDTLGRAAGWAFGGVRDDRRFPPARTTFSVPL